MNESFHLLASTNEFTLVLTHKSHPVCARNKAFSHNLGRYYAVQGTHDHLLAASEQTLLSRKVMEVMPRESADVLLAALREAAEHGSTHGVQISVNAPGGMIWFELSIARKATPPGQAQRLIVLSRNITEYKRIESELKQHRDHLQEMVDERTSEADHARWEAEQANQAKSMFLANMSHELRTPMHAVLSFATVGIERSKDAEGAAMEKCHHYFERISQSGNRLLSLLNDLLDLSKLEAGKMELDIHTYHLRGLVCEACDEMATLAENKGMTFDFSQVPAEMEINCDRMRIGQVLSNLLSNAIKFSPAIGTLHINATRVSLPGQGEGVAVRVQDEGVGIPPEELKSIFDNFRQSSRTASNAGGTGLGLSISREIVELHGGTIHAENNPESGAALIFTLPLHQPEMGVVDFGGGL
jgi:signal transduction histidine kinase